MHQFQPSSFPCMNARCFNGPRTLVSNKLRHFHGGRNESVFSSHAFLPALPPRCPSARRENEYLAPFPPIWTLSQAGDTLFSNQPFKLPEKVCNCIHFMLPSCQIISFLSSARKTQYAESHKKALLRPVRFRQPKPLCRVHEEGRFEWTCNPLQTALPAGFP